MRARECSDPSSSAPREAIGSWITWTLPDGRTLSQQGIPTRSDLFQVERPATFGLGEADETPKPKSAGRLAPGKSWRDKLEGLNADQLHKIV